MAKHYYNLAHLHRLANFMLKLAKHHKSYYALSMLANMLAHIANELQKLAKINIDLTWVSLTLSKYVLSINTT